MKNSKTTRKALFASALSLVLTTSMMIGTTWAWFTDSATSSNNKIQSGTLNIDLKVKNSDGDYVSVKNSNDPIFNYDKWEPGYTYATNVKVDTTGNLALKYSLKFASTADIASEKLAEVIDVYYAPSQVNVATRQTDYTTLGLRKLGTLKDVFEGGAQYEINDTLIPGSNTEDFATIVLKMQESAGNEYQGLSISSFDMKVLATQYTYEEDSFNNRYDAYATFPVATVAEFNNALSNASDGDTISISGTITLPADLTINKDITIDGNGNTVITEKPIHIAANNKVKFNNVKFDTVKNTNNNASFIYANKLAGELTVSGCTFTDTQWDSIQVTPVEGASIIVENCVFNTTDALQSANAGKSYRYIHIQNTDSNRGDDVNVTIVGNKFNNLDKLANSAIDIDYVGAGSDITVGKNEFNGVTVTASNLGDYIYICKGTSSAQVATMDTYNAFVASQTSKVSLS